MPEPLYDDDKCTYCGGDRRFEDRFVPGTLVLSKEGVRFVGEECSIDWPRSNIRGVKYAPTCPVDIEDISRQLGVGAAQDIEIGLAMDHVLEPALSFKVDDPEGVEPKGFDIRVIFRNDWHARVFGKRTEKALGVQFDSDEA